ncbi:hypothetical protein BDN70DRAFT_671117 [Pholiota conissans]|uniref:Mid2 domain-containing protein n=1 Tax=Pholiota conissans TaxID=109636 RepID=A0A9P5Z227_9AGAR|nr:hypothetical protein BDN70DRAFT_671117 [Pholiota conissans]
MLSSRRLIVPLFVYLSLLLATAVDAHDVLLQRRDHTNLKRLMKKRSPFPADDVPPSVVVGAGIIPTLPATTTDSTSTTSTTGSTSGTTSTTTTGSSTTTGTSTDTTTSGTSTSTSTTSTSTSTTSTSTTTSTTSTSTTAAPQTTPTLNLTDAPAAGSTVTVVPTLTRTASVDGATQTEVSTLSAAAASSNDTKGATATILIAVAASVGGIAILWTVFRKWKLASSKKFDKRLQPIDWQQPTDDDSGIPTHRRANSRASSFRSGSSNSGHGSRDPLDHDFTAGPSTVGGYADLARGPSPMPPMQEHLTRGPSFTRGFDNGVPLHHQGFSAPRY